MVLSLTLVCVIGGGLLAATYNLTYEPIAEAHAEALQEAIRNVIPEFDNDPAQDAYKAVTTEGDSLIIYPATKEGNPVGAAVESYSKNGFNGEIRVIVGFDAEDKLVNYSILFHNETPGLGSKMQEWFHTEKNQQSIIGRSLAEGRLAVTKDGGDIDAITASTITSRAFLEAINKAYSAYKNNKGATIVE